MRVHGSVLLYVHINPHWVGHLYVHRNHKAHWDGLLDFHTAPELCVGEKCVCEFKRV